MVDLAQVEQATQRGGWAGWGGRMARRTRGVLMTGATPRNGIPLPLRLTKRCGRPPYCDR